MALEIITCSTAFVVTLLPAFDKKENRKWRGILFVILGITSALPLFFAMGFR
jgi:predicted membrane channel-forming protein YqfA (hemolysin III family)